MNLFKKLFGKSNLPDKSNENKSLDIDKLTNSTDKNGSIIELDNYICKFCEYGDRLDKLTEPQKNFYYNQNLEREVNNGGFNQFYLNPSGDFAHETVNSLKEIGAHKTAEILQKANDQFPDKTVPKDREKRQETLEQIEDAANKIWEELDQKFFTYEDDLNSLNMDYVSKNRNDFK